MSYDLKYLKSRGVSSGDYKAIFTADKKPPLVKKLIDTIANRSRDGKHCNFKEYRAYWAIDLADEVPFTQTTPTLVQNLLSKHLTLDETRKELNAYGLSEDELFLTIEVDGQKVMVLNPPVFFQIFVPIVKAYTRIRQAKLYNDRDRSPFLPLTPLKQTDKNRLICEIWTDILDTVSGWYGYPVYMKQAILQMLKYGVMLAFTKEEWHCEKQVIDGREEVQKEGLRYDMPHPSQMSWDMYHPMPMINTDTGPEWACHWSVIRAGEVMDNRMFWNRDAISFGENWLNPRLSYNYFTEVFPCQLNFPTIGDNTMHREAKAAYYSNDYRDTALFFTHFFWKIVPSRWGLANYKFPVWHRFIIAGDDTVLWAAPCGYNPIWGMGYDFDNQAATNSSLALELIPWQDHVGNLLSQSILTAKQNLSSITFYDENVVDQKEIKALKNLGENRYRSFNYVPYNTLKMARAGLDIKSVFHTPQLAYRPVTEMQSLLSTALTIMERVMQFSAQETGAVAQHYQSAKEIGITAQSVSERVKLTAAGVDDGTDAWVRQLVDASQCYMNNKVVAQVSADIPDLGEHVRAIGFETRGVGPRKVLVAGSKKGLKLEGFARMNVPPGLSADKEMAQVIFQTLTALAQNPELAGRVGYSRIVKLMETGAKLAGAPRDFDLTTPVEDAQANAQMMQQLAPVLEQMKQAIMGEVTQTIAAPAAQQAAETDQRLDLLESLTKQLETIWRAAGMDAERLKMEAAKTAQQMQLERAEFEAEQARKQAKHQQDLQLTAAAAAAETQTATQKANVDAAAKVATTTANIAATEKKADATAKATRMKASATMAATEAGAKTGKS